MHDTIGLDQVLRAAVLSERSSAAFYTALADAVSDESVRAIFREMAEQENVHAVAIEALGERFVSGALPTLPAADFARVEQIPGWEHERAITLDKALDLAAAAETNAGAVYEALSRVFEGKVSELFASLSSAERQHGRNLDVVRMRAGPGLMANEVRLDPARFERPDDEPPPAERTWESGEELITAASSTTRVWNETVSEAAPIGSSAPLLRRVLVGRRAGIRELLFDRDGRRLVTLDEAGELLVWDVADGRILAELDTPTDGISSLALSPDGVTLAVGSPSGALVLWDLGTLDVPGDG